MNQEMAVKVGVRGLVSIGVAALCMLSTGCGKPSVDPRGDAGAASSVSPQTVLLREAGNSHVLSLTEYFPVAEKSRLREKIEFNDSRDYAVLSLGWKMGILGLRPVG